MDRLATTGVTLTSYYTAPSCTPARAALMTGRYPHKVGMGCDGVGSFLINSKYGLGLEHQLMPEVFREAGYVTHMVGKWNLGHFSDSHLPHRRGFETFLGYNGDEETYYSHHAFGISPVYNSSFCDFVYCDSAVGVRFGDCQDGDYSTDVYAKRVLELLRVHDDSNQTSPLFLYVAWQAVHSPLEDPPDMTMSVAQQEMISDLALLNVTGDEDRRTTFARMLMYLDLGVKSIIDELDELKQMSNTVVVVASDNGGCPSEGGNNYPLRGSKFTQFQGGVNVPAFIFSPLLSDAAQGSTYTGMFHVTDWLPTLANAAGLSGLTRNMQLDGIDLWNSLNQVGLDETGAVQPARAELVLHLNAWEFPRDATDMSVRATLVNASLVAGSIIVNGTWKLIVGEEYSDVFSPDSDSGTDGCEMMPEPDAVYLFDLATDPSEATNLANDTAHAAVLAEVMAALMREYTSQGSASVTWRNSDDAAFDVWSAAGNFVVPWNSTDAEPVSPMDEPPEKPIEAKPVSPADAPTAMDSSATLIDEDDDEPQDVEAALEEGKYHDGR
mmetsp:Transcript_12097/g.32716  ORF Transcript_12097/g.32716 Transcript_12097/m.32716 type:complete len:553 (+) Transcript_12097:636-2294(+)